MHSTTGFTRFFIHSINSKHSAAFLVSPFRQSGLPVTLSQALSRTHRRYVLRRSIASTIAASAKTSSTRRTKKSEQYAGANPSFPSSNEHKSTLVIVESPAKASTIQSILPSSEYIVRSCVGHIREIPSSAKRIPNKYKEYPWARLGVDVTSDFRPIYVLISGKHAILTELRAELRRSSCLVLATDDDREGEAISWHLLETLKPTVPVHRAVFHEITPNAVQAAFSAFRELNMSLVDAQETRRVLDRLAGYTMSPLLWKKIARGLSAGRVQSVAMSEIVRRERERLQFKAAQYAGCSATFIPSSLKKNVPFEATLGVVDGLRLVRGSDFDDATGRLSPVVDAATVHVYDNLAMRDLCRRISTTGRALIASVECRRTSRNPPVPLITSTLQQECGNKLGMGAGRTMALAQKLYETGIITYMRTDNPTFSDDAVKACRASIERLYGKKALWDGSGRPRGAKPKAAQAAHEAIRPAGTHFPHPDELTSLSNSEQAVYAIIFRRALASQMAPAKLDQTTMRLHVTLDDQNGPERQLEFRATGSVVVDPGFLQVYQDDAVDKSSTFLPPLSEGDIVNLCSTSMLDHETKPPPRFNDASLVKVLEEQGVGRPSTYAGIIEKLITRGYVYRGRDLPAEKKVPPKALVPSLTAFAVESLLSTHFPSFVDPEFTARMEKVLDEIAAGSANRVKYLEEYYCGENGLAESVARKEKDIETSKFKCVTLPNMPQEMIEHSTSGKPVSSSSSKTDTKENGKKKTKRGADAKKKSNDISLSKTRDGCIDWSSTKVLVNSYGPYVEQEGRVVASLPKTTLADDLSPDRLSNLLQLARDPVIGKDPETNLDVLLRTSRFGPYVQLGRDEDVPKGSKPKRCGLLADIDVNEITLDLALRLLSLPRLLGTHPQSGEEIRAAIGPYGPYVVHGNTFVSLKKDEHDVLQITLEDALALVGAAEARKQKRMKSSDRKSEATSANQASSNVVSDTKVSSSQTQTRKNSKTKARSKSKV